MREIKFRAWDKEGKKMYHFSQHGFCSEYQLLSFKLQEKQSSGFCFCEYDLFPVMQFTGLKDNDGREIYEGDIAKVTNLKCQLQKAILAGRVFFDYGAFGLEILYVGQWEGYNVEPPEKLDRLWFLNISDSKDIKVIGNIYENPEWLKEEKKWTNKKNYVQQLTSLQVQ